MALFITAVYTEGAILLLDEPGLYLYARSQGDLPRHLEDDFANQIVFTTHAPFMVPTHPLAWVRTVNIAEEAGPTVSNDPTGDARTLFLLLKGKTLELNSRIPRIARRFEAAFNALSIPFHKTRPSRLFLQKMTTHPSSVLSAESEAQFERLCKAINQSLSKHLSRSSS